MGKKKVAKKKGISEKNQKEMIDVLDNALVRAAELMLDKEAIVLGKAAMTSALKRENLAYNEQNLRALRVGMQVAISAGEAATPALMVVSKLIHDEK